MSDRRNSTEQFARIPCPGLSNAKLDERHVALDMFESDPSLLAATKVKFYSPKKE